MRARFKVTTQYTLQIRSLQRTFYANVTCIVYCKKLEKKSSTKTAQNTTNSDATNRLRQDTVPMYSKIHHRVGVR
jgi:hypothetical protein